MQPFYFLLSPHRFSFSKFWDFIHLLYFWNSNCPHFCKTIAAPCNSKYLSGRKYSSTGFFIVTDRIHFISMKSFIIFHFHGTCRTTAYAPHALLEIAVAGPGVFCFVSLMFVIISYSRIVLSSVFWMVMALWKFCIDCLWNLSDDIILFWSGDDNFSIAGTSKTRPPHGRCIYIYIGCI